MCKVLAVQTQHLCENWMWWCVPGTTALSRQESETYWPVLRKMIFRWNKTPPALKVGKQLRKTSTCGLHNSTYAGTHAHTHIHTELAIAAPQHPPPTVIHWRLCPHQKHCSEKAWLQCPEWRKRLDHEGFAFISGLIHWQILNWLLRNGENCGR